MEKHEAVYKKLRNSGFNGWGGTNYDNRMKGWDEQLERLFELIKLKKGKVLEMGCGAGDISIRLAQRGLDVTGIDISPTAIDWAIQKSKQLNLDIEFIVGSVYDKSILDKRKYDLIIDGNCLHCLFDEERMGFYDNLARLIDKNGSIFISSAILLNEGDDIPKISSIERCFVTKDAIEEELERRGFNLKSEWFSNGTHNHYYGVYSVR